MEVKTRFCLNIPLNLICNTVPTKSVSVIEKGKINLKIISHAMPPAIAPWPLVAPDPTSQKHLVKNYDILYNIKSRGTY